MPTKFPIDYEPGKVQAFLISKETGQMIEATPLTEITPKPWPIDDINEPEPPMVFTNTVTVKMSKKAARNFKRLNKMPRKLKKAFRHIGLVFGPMTKTREGRSFVVRQDMWIGPKDGYPKTKWIMKALRIYKPILVKQ